LKRWLRRAAVVFAVLGSGVAMLAAAMVVWSVVRRALTSNPIQGDVELVQLGIAVAIALALPWCQLQRANIIVDFFTQGLPQRASRRMDALGCVLVALMCGLLAWRTAVGAIAVREGGETTMILALPMWWVYASLAPGLALAAVIALQQAWQHVRLAPEDDDSASNALGDSAAGADQATAVKP
jgi:TRAP-type C4-dicarboxylate transport system permease small subunit